MNAHLPIADDPVLRRLRAAIEEMYGAPLARVVLFGSRASGTARPDSDCDIAVFRNSLPDQWAEFDRLADLRVRFIDDTGIEAFPYAADAVHDATPLMHEIRRTGVDL